MPVTKTSAPKVVTPDPYLNWDDCGIPTNRSPEIDGYSKISPKNSTEPPPVKPAPASASAPSAPASPVRSSATRESSLLAPSSSAPAPVGEPAAPVVSDSERLKRAIEFLSQNDNSSARRELDQIDIDQCDDTKILTQANKLYTLLGAKDIANRLQIKERLLNAAKTTRTLEALLTWTAAQLHSDFCNHYTLNHQAQIFANSNAAAIAQNIASALVVAEAWLERTAEERATGKPVHMSYNMVFCALYLCNSARKDAALAQRAANFIAAAWDQSATDYFRKMNPNTEIQGILKNNLDLIGPLLQSRGIER